MVSTGCVTVGSLQFFGRAGEGDAEKIRPVYGRSVAHTLDYRLRAGRGMDRPALHHIWRFHGEPFGSTHAGSLGIPTLSFAVELVLPLSRTNVRLSMRDLRDTIARARSVRITRVGDMDPRNRASGETVALVTDPAALHASRKPSSDGDNGRLTPDSVSPIGSFAGSASADGQGRGRRSTGQRPPAPNARRTRSETAGNA